MFLYFFIFLFPCIYFFFFFFQAEDGIRDGTVTGVQRVLFRSISSHELGRALGVTQTTAWFMLQRIREVMKKHSFDTSKIGGEGTEVEADETFVGGKVKNMHRSRCVQFATEEGYAGGATGKTIVQGILDRTLRQVRATVVPNVTR